MSLAGTLTTPLRHGVRYLHAQAYTPLRLRLIAALLGTERALDDIGRLPMAEIPAALRMFGATVGEKAYIRPGMRFENTHGSLRNLTIGNNVYIGSCVLFDLTAPIRISDDAAIGPCVVLITHRSLGDRPGALNYPTVSDGITLERAAMLATGAVVLHGVTLGENSAVGAQAMVARDVRPLGLAVGVPARVMRNVPEAIREAMPTGPQPEATHASAELEQTAAAGR